MSQYQAIQVLRAQAIERGLPVKRCVALDDLKALLARPQSSHTGASGKRPAPGCDVASHKHVGLEGSTSASCDGSTDLQVKKEGVIEGKVGAMNGKQGTRVGLGLGSATKNPGVVTPASGATGPTNNFPIEVRRVLSASSFYSRLDVAKDANEVEIRKAYRDLALRFHPDSSAIPGGSLAYEMVTQAYDTLIDGAKRQSYDESMAFVAFDTPSIQEQIRTYADKYGDENAVRKYTSKIQKPPEPAKLPHFTAISQMPSPRRRRRRRGQRFKTGRSRRRLAPVVFVSDKTDHNENQCRYCRQPGELLLCDGCPFAAHTDCIQPPVDIDSLPEGDWFCPSCVAQQQNGEARSTVVNVPPSVPDPMIGVTSAAAPKKPSGPGTTIPATPSTSRVGAGASVGTGGGKGGGRHNGAKGETTTTSHTTTGAAHAPPQARVTVGPEGQPITVLVLSGEANDGNDDLCRECHKPGDLVLCDGCTYAGHPTCQKPPLHGPIEDLPDEWFCRTCVATGKGSNTQ